MKVSVVISTNGRRELEECLNSLEGQTYDNFEIIVVPNRDISDRLDKYDVKYFTSERGNVSVQRNLGIERADGEIVAFIDDDAIAHESWLENLVKHYKNEDVMCVGGRVIPNFESEIPNSIEKLDNHILFGLMGATFIKWDDAGEIKSPLIWGCNISFRREIFDEVGYFPKELGRSEGNLMGGEETYLQIEIMKKGYKVIYEPNSIVEHSINEDQLTEEYLVKRSFWQGLSEIERLRINGNFRDLVHFDDEIKRIIPIKFLQMANKIYGLSDLKEKIDVARSMGRLFGLRKLEGGFVNG